MKSLHSFGRERFQAQLQVQRQSTARPLRRWEVSLAVSSARMVRSAQMCLWRNLSSLFLVTSVGQGIVGVDVLRERQNQSNPIDGWSPLNIASNARETRRPRMTWWQQKWPSPDCRTTTSLELEGTFLEGPSSRRRLKVEEKRSELVVWSVIQGSYDHIADTLWSCHCSRRSADWLDCSSSNWVSKWNWWYQRSTPKSACKCRSRAMRSKFLSWLRSSLWYSQAVGIASISWNVEDSLNCSR